MNHTSIFNDKNTTFAVNQLPVILMQPMDHLLNLLCIHSVVHLREFEKDFVHIHFNKGLEPNFEQIFETFTQFGFQIVAKNYFEKSNYLTIIVKQSKAILN